MTMTMATLTCWTSRRYTTGTELQRWTRLHEAPPVTQSNGYIQATMKSGDKFTLDARGCAGRTIRSLWKPPREIYTRISSQRGTC